jgi:uncharacterized protein (UPF0548 family)
VDRRPLMGIREPTRLLEEQDSMHKAIAIYGTFVV